MKRHVKYATLCMLMVTMADAADAGKKLTPPPPPPLQQTNIAAPHLSAAEIIMQKLKKPQKKGFEAAWRIAKGQTPARPQRDGSKPAAQQVILKAELYKRAAQPAPDHKQ